MHLFSSLLYHYAKMHAGSTLRALQKYAECKHGSMKTFLLTDIAYQCSYWCPANIPLAYLKVTHSFGGHSPCTLSEPNLKHLALNAWRPYLAKVACFVHAGQTGSARELSPPRSNFQTMRARSWWINSPTSSPSWRDSSKV